MTKATTYFKCAASLPPDFCFPNRIEEVSALKQALVINPQDAKAFYYLGNFWYDKRQYSDAIECREQSIKRASNFPTVLRNLSLVCYNRLNHPERALDLLERASALDETDARILMELDQLYKKLNTPHQQRLSFFEKHLSLVESRDDLYLERVTLYNQLGEHQKAKDLIAAYKFHLGKVAKERLSANT